MTLKKFFIAMMTVISFAGTPAQAAGPTGHSDLMELMFHMFGLDPDVSMYASALNQGVDVVPFLNAIQSGAASEHFHFKPQTTEYDIRESQLKLNANNKQSWMKAITAWLSNDFLGGNSPSVGNEGAFEFGTNGIRAKDFLMAIMGTHTELDIGGGFHSGYKGSIDNLIPYGHLSDGTDADRITSGKVFLSFYTIGSIIITIRNAQLKAGGQGVNTRWLAELTRRGVDVNDNMSMLRWFFNEPVVRLAFENLPAKSNPRYLEVVIDEMHRRLKDAKIFKSEDYLQSEFAKIYDEMLTESAQFAKPTLEHLLKDMFERAVIAKELDEPKVISDVFSKYRSGATELSQLTPEGMDDPLQGMPEWLIEGVGGVKETLADRGGHLPYSEGWKIMRMMGTYSHGLLRLSGARFDSSYLFKPAETMAAKIETETIESIQKAYGKFFGAKAIFHPDPKAAYWDQVWENYRMYPDSVKTTFVDRFVALNHAIVNTVIDPDHPIKTLDTVTKIKMYLKGKAYLLHEVFRSPLTTPGSLDPQFQEQREALEDEGAILKMADLTSWMQFMDEVNAKYNNSEIRVGITQKLAGWVSDRYAGRLELPTNTKSAPALGTVATAAARCEGALGSEE